MIIIIMYNKYSMVILLFSQVVGMRSQPAVDLSIDGSPIKTRPSGFNPNMRAYQLNRDLNNDTPASVYRGHHGICTCSNLACLLSSSCS